MKSQVVLFLLVFVLLSCTSNQTNSAAPPFLPPENQILTFAHQLSYPGYPEHNLPEPFGCTVYASLFQDVSVELTSGHRIRHLRILLDNLGTQVPLVLLRPTNTQLAGIPNGQFD